MRRSFPLGTALVAIATCLSTPAFAHQGRAPRLLGYTADGPRGRVSVALQSQQLRNRVTFHGRQARQVVTNTFNNDSWKAELRGLRDGDRVTIDVQDKSRAIGGACPAETVTRALSGPGRTTKLRALLREALQIRRLVDERGVQPPEPKRDALGKLTCGDPLSIEGKDAVRSGTTARVRVRAAGGATVACTTATFGKPGYRSWDKNVVFYNNYRGQDELGHRVGLFDEAKQPKDARVYRETLAMFRDKAGYQPKDGSFGWRQELHGGGGKPWLQRDNLFVTPAYEDAKTGKGRADLVGLAALPSGTKVRIENMTLGKRIGAGATVETVASRGTGSIKLALPAPAAGCEYKLQIDGRSPVYFKLPGPDSRQVQARGFALYNVELTAQPLGDAHPNY